MHSRYLLAITTSALTAVLLSPSTCASEMQWSPLSKDVEKDVESHEPAAELSHFRKLRADMDAQAEAEKQAAKGKGLLGRFRKSKAPTTNAWENIQEQAPANEDELPSRQVAGFKKPGELREEPGTAPSKELAPTDRMDDAEADAEEEDENKRARAIPGEKPTEETLDSNYFLKRSQAFARKKDFQSALNYIDRALELQPQNWECSYQKALIYQLAGYDAAAARRYLKIIAHRPDMLEPHIAMGMLYRKHNNFDLAEIEYEDAIQIKYHSFPAHFNLANLFMDQKKYEQALKEYKVCQKLQPNNALVHNNIGVIFQQRNYLEEAAQEFHRASNLEPANKMYQDNLNAVRNQLGSKHAVKPVAM